MGTLSLFEPFYSENRAVREVGEIWYIPCPDVQEVPTILDVERASATEHHRVDFKLCDISPDTHFREDGKSLPVKLLNLKANEELIAAKGKLRPCVVLAQLPIVNTDEVPEGRERKLAQHLSKGTFLVAPMYSVASPNLPGTYMTTIVERIRRLSYLHLFCLPEEKQPELPRSIVRLDRVFVSYLGRGCSPGRVTINSDPMNMIRMQLSIIYDLPISEDDLQHFEGIRELLRDS